MSENKVNIGFAIKECRKRKGISQEDLALSCDLDRTYISMLERNIKSPTLTTLQKIITQLDISLSFLISIAENEKTIDQKNNINKKEKWKLPFMGTAVSCGTPVTEDYKIEKEISLDELIIQNPKRTFFINATGDSMTPTVNNGDTLVFELNSKPRNNSIVLVQIGNGFTVKRFVKSQNGFKLIPDNPLFEPVELNDEIEIKICGTLVGLVRLI